MLNIYSQVQSLGTILPASRPIQPIADHFLTTFTANNNLSDWTFKIASISLLFKWNNLPGWQTKHYKLFLTLVCFSQPLLQWYRKKHAELAKYQIFAQLHQTFSTAFLKKVCSLLLSLLWKQVYRTSGQNKHWKHFVKQEVEKLVSFLKPSM